MKLWEQQEGSQGASLPQSMLSSQMKTWNRGSLFTLPIRLQMHIFKYSDDLGIGQSNF